MVKRKIKNGIGFTFDVLVINFQANENLKRLVAWSSYNLNNVYAQPPHVFSLQ
jgi:hypothetical protein